MSTYLGCDFEYNKSKNSKLNLVCCAFEYEGKIEEFWIYHDKKEYKRLKDRLLEIQRKETDLIILAYNVVAEARSFIALEINPLDFNWIDLYLEYRCLTNHNHKMMYGKQMMKGRKKFTVPPKKNKWEMTEEDKKKSQSGKPEHNLVAACYKMLGVTIDNDFKNETRDLILEEKDAYNVDERDQITTYCASDIKYLIQLFRAIVAEYKRLLGPKFDRVQLKKEMLNRAEYSVHSAYMEDLGYPVNISKVKNFTKHLPNIIWECQHDINKNLGIPLFRYPTKAKSKAMVFSLDTKLAKEMIKKWCADNKYKGWMLTDKKDISLKLDAFTKPISYRHDYPEGNFIAQMQRYLKLKQSLNGFSVTARNTIYDYIGTDDDRVRPYMGIFGAQSSRSQPSATGFIPLKAAWMRSMIEPPEGMAMIGVDWASQEFLIAGLLSNDKEMINAYASGDVYLAFGKAIGYIPSHGTKGTHGEHRDNCKAVVLGLSYDMSEYGLAHDLSDKFGRTVTPEEALKWINQHKRAYPTFWKWKAKIQKEYRLNKSIKLADGWYMWGDNPNFRSIGNVPVQGMGAAIMRKAVQLAHARGIKLPYTLHDALYAQCKSLQSRIVASRLCECMDEAFRFYFGDLKKIATCRLDVDIWGPEIEDGGKGVIKYEDYLGRSYDAPFKEQTIYIDPRAKKEYNKFKSYLTLEMELEDGDETEEF